MSGQAALPAAPALPTAPARPARFRGPRSLRAAAAMVAAVLVVSLAGLTAGTDPASASDPASPPVPSASAAPGAAAGQQSTTSSMATAEPLVIVLDLSGSMEEDDGSGTIRLDGAKTALIDVVRGQRSGASLGLWTYPTRGVDCSVGGYVPGAELGTVADPSVLAATIRNLQAEGGTPTGDALQAVADDLRARNNTSATLLLVSDGESNCGVPPCEVAQQLVDDGFDITVQAMGFQISDVGRAELECIAAATSGSYYDVEDSAELGELLDEISVPTLALDVTAVESVPSGSATTITAVVSNPSAQSVEDVSVSLSFADADARTLFPAVIPPRYRLGNLPAGATVTRSWTLSTAGGRTGEAGWRVSAWTPDVGATSATGQIEVVDSALGLSYAGALLTDALEQGPIVILGDSYSSGEGSGDYLSGLTDAQEGCHRSNNTYGVALFGSSSTEIIACSGAVAGDLISPNSKHQVDAQLAQVAALGDAPGLVLMTIGGNDIGFENIIKKCIMPDDCSQDTTFTAATFRDVGALQTSLAASYHAINGVVNSPDLVAERSGKHAPIVVLAYPQILPDWRRASCSGLRGSEVKFANDVVTALDEVVAAATEEAGAGGVPVYFAGHVQEAVLPNHTACSEEPFINPVDLAKGVAGLWDGSYVELAHPNVDGYQAIANSLVAWSQTDAATPRTTPTTPTTPTSTYAPAVVGVSAAVARIDLANPSAHAVRVPAGAAVDVLLSGLAPGTTVTITVRSAPRAIASWVVDDSGAVSGAVYIPGDLSAGAHTLVASGLDEDLAVLVAEQPLKVVQARPWWFWPAAGLSGALLLCAGGAFLVRRRVLGGASAEAS